MSSTTDSDNAETKGFSFSVDLVRGHPCFGCKHAILLPESQWTLTRRLGCLNASKRRVQLLKPLVNGLARYCEAEEHQFPNFKEYAQKTLGFITQRINRAYSLLYEEAHNDGYCLCEWDESVETLCKEEDREECRDVRQGVDGNDQAPSDGEERDICVQLQTAL